MVLANSEPNTGGDVVMRGRRRNIAKTIALALSLAPDESFSIMDLCYVVYPEAEVITKRQRTAVMNAVRKREARAAAEPTVDLVDLMKMYSEVTESHNTLDYVVSDEVRELFDEAAAPFVEGAARADGLNIVSEDQLIWSDGE